jgi:hypothetical protein
MSDTAAVEQRDEAIVEALVAGRSVRAVQREFSLTVAELDAALERCFPLDVSARLRTIRGDLGRLDRLIEKFYLKAMAGDGDVYSAALVVKAWERKAELLGLDAVQRIDLQIINPPQQVPRHEKIREAIMRLCGGPNWQPNDGNVSPLDDDDAVDELSPPNAKGSTSMVIATPFRWG